ncbi:MAG TPA: LacI family DNA-binding transcriptional regulator [Streptomyces sp.]|uniref:LacI family DNA-binding transcriptional regulator n=1 Tax=Streptomyces sp. TaxID=1931 RepID=UPI002C159B44|nr:LacI family DNA-binding transcriptional regulator [Streptomyces sp.]HWU09910.1 LacI family DNA-binding transcriptional regulator [Streptomyces sp.]
MTDAPRPAGAAPTLEDVAWAAGVSRATVSRVINGVRNVDPAIQEAVRQAVAVTGYAPNRAARSLVTRRTDAVAPVVSGAGAAGPEEGAGPAGEGGFTAQVFADPFFGRVVTGVVTISGPLDLSAGQERPAGFRDALAQHGVSRAPVVEGQFTQESGGTAMERLLTEHPDLDGVFAGNDLMATGACHVLRERGRRVPEDVSVIGFDDSSAASACRPPLTTVRQTVEDMAAETAGLLLDRLAVPDRPVTSVIFEPVLVVRDSA